jgi:hypothetical protein
MNGHNPIQHISPECVDVVMKELPEMYCSTCAAGNEEFIYGVTYFAVREELRRGATAGEIRTQRSQILRHIDRTGQAYHDDELFAALFARAVDDALEGRSPCVLH